MVWWKGGIPSEIAFEKAEWVYFIFFLWSNLVWVLALFQDQVIQFIPFQGNIYER